MIKRCPGTQGVETPHGSPPRLRVALISVHASPLAVLGGKDAGGMNLYVRELSRQLGDLDVAVDVFTHWRDCSQPQIVPLGPRARVVHLQAGPIAHLDKHALERDLPEFSYQLLRFREAQGLRYDLLHSHYWLSGRVAMWLSQHWHIPHVTMFHTLGEAKNRARLGEREHTARIESERRIIAAVDRIVAGSAQEKQLMIRVYDARPHRVTVIPPGVDLTQFRPGSQAAARRELGLGRGKVVLFVGRLEPLKGIDILLQALPRIEHRGPVRLLVAGGDAQGDPERARLERLATDLGIADRVTFLGPVDHDRLPALYRAADVCVVPSYYESFGLVAVEALACGTPVIASRVGGLIGTVADGETGFLVPWRCPEPFAERLELLLGNDALRAQFAAAAPGSVARFGWAGVARQVLDLYDDLAPSDRAQALGS
ncbi:MAG TPA: glycosyltransferase [Dehalococcoidia bacterium]|nr:glycosyltransferase [Dehalococcoidia bacterium]